METREPSVMDDLPDEVILNIFYCLEPSDLATCMLVSKEWNRFAGLCLVF